MNRTKIKTAKTKTTNRKTTKKNTKSWRQQQQKDNYDKGNYNKDNNDDRCQMPGFSQTYNSCLGPPHNWMWIFTWKMCLFSPPEEGTFYRSTAWGIRLSCWLPFGFPWTYLRSARQTSWNQIQAFLAVAKNMNGTCIDLCWYKQAGISWNYC